MNGEPVHERDVRFMNRHYSPTGQSTDLTLFTLTDANFPLTARRLYAGTALRAASGTWIAARPASASGRAKGQGHHALPITSYLYLSGQMAQQ
jgi:hypothetical protein